MRRLTSAASLTLAASLFAAPAAVARPNQGLVRDYLRAYHAVRSQLGPQAAGCNLIQRRGSCHVRATSADLVSSLGVLRRDLAPPPASVTSATTSDGSVPTSVASGGGSSAVTQSAASGSLAQCIVQRESSGNPQDVSGRYSGLANWSAEAWAEDGGTRYASSPTGASASQQMQVLDSALAAGKSGQWTPYDRC